MRTTITCWNESTLATWKEIIKEDDTVSTFKVTRNSEEDRGLVGEFTIEICFK